MNKELERIAREIACFNPKLWKQSSVTKESLQADYERLKDIPDSLQLPEIRLIWYLRNMERGEVHRFLSLAKSNYDIMQATLNLRNPTDALIHRLKCNENERQN